MVVSLRQLAPILGISPASLFGYRAGKIPISEKSWAKLESLEAEQSRSTVKEEGAIHQAGPPIQGLSSSDLEKFLDLVLQKMEAGDLSLENVKTARRLHDMLRSPPSQDRIVEFSEEPMTELPYYGAVAAGKPSDVDFYTDETRIVPGNYSKRPHYLLKVRGQSMEPDFPDGSYVVVRVLDVGEYPRKGDVVIAADANGPAMKRLEYRKEGSPGDTPRKPTAHLVSINPLFEEVIPVADCPVQGVVIECLPSDFFDP